MKRAFGVILMACLGVTSIGFQDRSAAAQKEYSLGEFDFDWYGSVSPDGRFITFVTWESGDLAVRDLGTGRNRNLTNKKGIWEYSLPPGSRENASNEFALFSAISHDSKHVAYTWFDDEGASLRLIGLDGSGLRILHHDPAIVSYEPRDWSPDGKKVLATFVRNDGANQIVLLSVVDGSVRMLRELTDLRSPLRMKFSPDGRYIAYDYPTARKTTNWEIFVLSSDGKRAVAVVDHVGNDLLIDWTPDGEGLIFESDRGGTPDIWLLPVSDGKRQGEARLVRPDVGPLFFPIGITREGSLYCGRMSEIDDLYVVEFDPASGKIRGSPTRLGPVGGMSSADWSPDGKKLVYPVRLGPLGTGYVAYSWALVVRSIEKGAERKIPIALSRIKAFQPQWSPDGHWLVATGIDAKGRQGVYRIQAQTGEVHPIVRQKGRGDSRLFHPGSAVWSLDARAVFYRRLSGGRISILVHNLDTGEEKELRGAEQPSSFLSSLALSPDGRWLAFVSGLSDEQQVSTALEIMLAGGGGSRKLLQVEWPEMLSHIAWMPDGRQLLFGKRVRFGQRDKLELWRISAEGGQPQSLGVTMEDRTLFGLSVHPDGRRIAFTAERPFRSELFVVENLLPASKPVR